MIYNPPQDPLDILYQDRDIVVVNKPSGLFSAPGKGPELQDSVQWRLQKQYPYAQCVHRLDLWTSGVLVLTIRKKAERELFRQFRDQLVQKTYHAIVAGALQESTGIIQAPLAPDPLNLPKQRIDFDTGKTAITHYTVLDCCQVLRPSVVQEHCETYSLIELKPKTGRSHQLRVHLAYIGHPIVGDPFYAPQQVLQASSRLELHASTIQFNHPYSGKALEFHAAIETEFSRTHFQKSMASFSARAK